MDVDQEIESADTRLLYVWAENDNVDVQRRGRAKAEIERRQRDYQESREETRRNHEVRLFEAEGHREVSRKVFQERLAHEQMAHAEKLVADQTAAARASAKATVTAAWAAGFSALGALISAGAAVFALMR